MSADGGLANAHTHIYSGLAPLGIPAAEPAPTCFVEILERLWWRLDRALDAHSLRASARLYVAEALLHGTTALVDHHESPEFIEGSLDVLADACQQLGMRALVCYGATERNGGAEEARRGLEECRRFVRDNDRPLVRGCVGLHASFTVSDDTIRAAGELCGELGVVMHVHVAEDGADVEDARRRGWEGPLERLHALGALPPGSILAHGVHLDERQVRKAWQWGLWLVQNPRSNRGNGVGYAAALGASDRVALGTDGYPSDLADELDALEGEARAHADSPPRVSARLGGSQALAREALGAPLPAAPRTGVEEAIAFARATQAERRARTEVEGRVVVERGRLVSGDLDQIRAEARTEAPRLWQRMREIEP